MSLGLALSAALTGAAGAQAPTPAEAAAAAAHWQDLKLAPAGHYTLDPKHVAVIARVLHRTFSMSVFRFGAVSGTLEWDPAHIAASKLTATVETGSIQTNVEGFPKQLTGFLKSAEFPQATFVSTAFRQTDATHGQVDGQFTLMGVTEPMTFQVSLVGAGPGFTGAGVMGHVIGIHAESAINPHHYKLPPIFGDSLALVIDTEFDRAPGG
jgi:polyisoprenoid-binding protein YceI